METNLYEDDQLEIFKRVDNFVEDEIKPLERLHPELFARPDAKFTPRGNLKKNYVDLVREIRKRSAAEGLLTFHFPKSLGGEGGNLTDLSLGLSKTYSYGVGPSRYIIDDTLGFHPAFHEMSSRIHEQFLEPLVAGEKIGGFALTERTSGSDALSLNTVASQRESSWVINGHKAWVSHLPYSDFVLLFAKTEDADRKINTISAFLVETDNPGLKISQTYSTMDMTGIYGEFELNDCEVPEDQLVGERGKGFHYAIQMIDKARIRMASRCCGLLDYLLDASVEYSQSRTSWEKPIGKNQQIRTMIAEISMWRDITQILIQKYSRLIESGRINNKQSAAAKYFSTEVLAQAADHAVQIHGANGLREDEYSISSVYRYVRSLRIRDGTSEILLERIAQEEGL